MKYEEHNVAKHYEGAVFQFELERLEKHCPVEYAITCRYFERFISSEGSTVADIGVGTGHYAAFLARRGSTVHLVDVSERLLRAARE